MPRCSVIIPTFRRPTMLREAVASVLAQTQTDLEVIVVDDAGGEVGELPVDPRVRVVGRSVGGGQGAAINTGVGVARGDLLAFLDDDDWFDPRRLELTLRALEAAPVVVCWSRFHDASPRAGRLLDGDVEETILDATTPNLGATAVRQDAFLPFDEAFPASADVEWWIRMSQSAQVRTVPHVSHVMRRHSGPRVLNSREARIRATLRMLDLHSDWFQRHPRALAFRYYRLGIAAASSGDYRLARRSFLRSAGMKPTARVVKQLIGSARPTHQDLGITLPTKPTASSKT